MVCLDKVWLNKTNILVGLKKRCLNQENISVFSTKWFGSIEYTFFMDVYK